jgi:hypothetical protein
MLFRVFVLCAYVAVVSAQEAVPYNETLALRLVEYAFASYTTASGFPKVAAWNCSCCKRLEGVEGVSVFNSTENVLFGFTVQKDAFLEGAGVVSFRGTLATSLKNWIQDLHASKTAPYGNKTFKVHKGFYDDYLSLRSQIVSQIKLLKRVYVTGHSLGAAMAQLCALDLRDSFPEMEIVAVYSYGTPRVGDKDFVGYYESRIGAVSWRVVHWRDIVPRLPPRTLFFEHTNNEAFYSESFNLLSICNIPESKNCSDGIIGDSVADHIDYFNLTHYDCHNTTTK